MTAKKIKKTCFVVGPIGEDGSDTRRAADWVLQGIIKPVFDDAFRDFEVVRSDTITAPGMIDVQMINHLLDADLVIADMSERNPNAFYEMGIRHMAQKPIVHMFSEGTVIPFDVAPYRAIKFSIDTFDRLQRAKAELKAVVEEVLKPEFKVENPVTRARGIQAIEQKASPEVQVLFEEIAELRRRMDAKLSPSTYRVANALLSGSAYSTETLSFIISFKPAADKALVERKIREGPFAILMWESDEQSIKVTIGAQTAENAHNYFSMIPGVRGVNLVGRGLINDGRPPGVFG
jgi:hypothetical protein